MDYFTGLPAFSDKVNEKSGNSLIIITEKAGENFVKLFAILEHS